jgi:hypothetical protein
LADTLCERETLDTPELMEIFGDLPVWDGMQASNGATKTTRTRRTSRSASTS